MLRMPIPRRGMSWAAIKLVAIRGTPDRTTIFRTRNALCIVLCMKAETTNNNNNPPGEGSIHIIVYVIDDLNV